ncbi:hypothetical protein BH24CHL4_BH24CHL4_02720 [soil metagenome]
MRWGGDEVGVVLTRNEVWLLLHALAGARLPAVDWEGNALEPWVVGELRARLQAALRPDPLSDVEERPIIRLDSDMGRSLAMAEVRPLVIEDGYDLGSLFAACAERGWGAELRLPVGGGVETPAEAVVTVGTGHWALGTGEQAAVSGQREFVGLERPVVAFARALVGAAGDEGTGHWALGTGYDEGKGQRAKDKGDEAASGEALIPGPSSNAGRQKNGGQREFDEHVIFSDGIAPGERDATVARMAARGWELVRDEGERMVFRRGVGNWEQGTRQ